VKLAEFLAAGLPVVTTPFGMRGLPVREIAGLEVVPREDFVEVLAGDLPTSVEGRRRLATLSWDHIGAELLDAYRGVLASRKANPAAS